MRSLVKTTCPHASFWSERKERERVRVEVRLEVRKNEGMRV